MTVFETSLNVVLVDTFNLILKHEEEAINKILSVPVSVTEAHVIEAVGKLKDRVTASGVASLLNISKPTATVAIQKLEERGFIQRIRCDADRRKRLISLTETGKKIEKYHRAFHEKMVKTISGQFPEDEKKILLSLINKLNLFFRMNFE